MAKKECITIAGLPFFHGRQPFDGNKYIILRKDPSNPHDTEAILAETALWGIVGYVASHPAVRLTGTYSAGRIYDRIGRRAIAKVRFISDEQVVCSIIRGKKAKKLLARFDEQAKDMRSLENSFFQEIPGQIVFRFIQAIDEDDTGSFNR